MGAKSSERSLLREFLRSKSGVVGLVMMGLLVSASLYVVATTSKSDVIKWNDPAAWQGNPAAAPPTWVNYFGVDAPASVGLTLAHWSGSTSATGSAYSATATFDWKHGVPASNLDVIPVFNGTAYEIEVLWTKPDGDTLQMSLTTPVSGTDYDLTTPSFQQGVITYVQGQTHTYLQSVSPTQELAALFNEDGASLLNGSVQQGVYTLSFQMVGSSALSPLNSRISVVGDSYGTMGTDNSGRPIDLGVLAGLPWALEIGVLGSAVCVVGGILWGGLAGFLGGWREKVMSWMTLVVLAIPGLAYLVAISYSFGFTSLSEALLIAALSWPFFAIIARSVTISVKSQTYVEADRAMGVSSITTFVTHFVPRLTPVTIAFTALSVSGFIITGETLAFLGIEPANVVTWGGILNNAIAYDAAANGWWWWVLFPGIMIIVASIPFVLVGFALDKLVAPRVTAR